MSEHRTYVARLHTLNLSGFELKLAGTLDGFVDFATPRGTYTITPFEARRLATALLAVCADIHQNCLYDADALLEPEQPA